VAFFVGGEGFEQVRTAAVREGEKPTARSARRREVFRVAATWVLSTEFRRTRAGETLSCNSASKALVALCDDLSFSANESHPNGWLFSLAERDSNK